MVLHLQLHWLEGTAATELLLPVIDSQMTITETWRKRCWWTMAWQCWKC